MAQTETHVIKIAFIFPISLNCKLFAYKKR